MRTPVSTYRLQIRPGFTLQDAAETVPYLKSLGVDWIYLSPILTAEKGSDHGYDVTDPSAIDPDRGGPEGLAAASRAAREAGMGVLVDIVPNHVGVATPVQNPWWWSLLKEGQQSRYAQAFDVDWDFGGGRIRIPVLGSDSDVDALEIKDGELRYYDHRFPLAEGSYTAGDPTADDPREVHDRQHYELVGWRRADNELNYRRFFAVNSLAGIRVELPEVFDEAHAEIVRWFREGLVDGLRIDHPDGLADPEGYLRRLREVTGGSYLLIEKILEPGEVLPESFDCEGTTGYDALADVDRLFVDPAGQDALDALDAELRGGQAADYEDMIRGTKRRITDGILHSEMLRLARLVPSGTGLTVEAAADALSEIIAAFPVYRSYLPEGADVLKEACELAVRAPSGAGRRRRAAAAAAPRRRPGAGRRTGAPLPADLRHGHGQGRGGHRVLPLHPAGHPDGGRGRPHRVLRRAGGIPPPDGPPPGRDPAVHDHAEHPRHQTQRGHPRPDLRARGGWRGSGRPPWPGCRSWRRCPTGRSPTCCGRPSPVPGPRTVTGCSRMRRRPPGRPATPPTGWTRTPPSRRSWPPPSTRPSTTLSVRAELESLVELLAPYGAVNSLGAKLVQLTMPGVPDVYQGTEFWDRSLTDPDNRRPFDFGARRTALAALDAGDRPASYTDDAREAPGHLAGPAPAPRPPGAVHGLPARRGNRRGRRAPRRL